MKKFVITLLIIMFTKTGFSESVVIRESAPHDPLRITVLPIKCFGKEKNEANIVTDQLIRTLSDTSFLKVLPLKVTLEILWKYYPEQFSVKPDEYSPNQNPPEGLEFFGHLRPIEKETLSTYLSSEYIIDGTFAKEENARHLALDIYSEKENRIKISFSKKLTSEDTVFESTHILAQEIINYFFDILSDDIVLKIIRNKTAGKISFDETLSRLDDLETSYPKNVFVHSGKLILYHEEQESPDTIIIAGKKWFSLKDHQQTKQIRFFQSTDSNPYLFLAQAYMSRKKYRDAQKIFYQGNKTFPFNTKKLKREFMSCLELLGETEKLNLLKQEHK